MIDNLRRVDNFKTLIERIKNLPSPQTEESILLRVLVQGMVIVGIIATDVAAQSTFPMSIWAIPLSIVGAVVSWRKRKEKNIGIKFGLAIAMIGALLLFLGKLIGSINDTRLVLAELLVQLQVLHSFDLPRRKDLGYSMVIGLILIGVSATLSQTLAFAPWLVLFLILGIPTLILDYRSRMGLNIWELHLRHNKSQPRANSSLSVKRTVRFISIIVVLGLLIFAIMPRYPGYQIQTFPVNAPDAYKNQNFVGEDKSIVNPGYNSDGTLRQDLTGTTTQGGDGYYGFNTEINQNFSSIIQNKKLLFRIRSQYPGYWRVLAFDDYTGQGWKIKREQQTANITRNRWSYQFILPSPPFKVETKKVIQTYTVVTDLPNIIPSLQYPKSVFFPAAEIAFDSEGGLRSPAGLLEGLTYTVISRVPYRYQSQLQEAGNDYPDVIRKYYLDISPELKEKVKVKAQELLAKSEREFTSNYDIALYLAQALKQNYTLQMNIPRLEEGEDLVEAFLYQNQGGYPDHFATVYTLMLRSLEIPSRLVVGFGTGQFNPFTGYYLVHNTDAYAMTEVYFPEYGWFSFDPLPGHEIIPFSFQDQTSFGVLGWLWKWVASWLPSPITAFISILVEKITTAIASFFQSGWFAQLWQFITGSFVGVLVGILGFIVCVFIGWLVAKYLQQLIYRRRLSQLQPMAKLYRQMLDLLAEQGHPKKSTQTPYEYSRSLNHGFTSEQLEIITSITDSYVQWRYGKLIPNLDYLRSQFQLLERSLSRLPKQIPLVNSQG